MPITLTEAKQKFDEIWGEIDQHHMAEFLQWIGDSFSVVDGGRSAPQNGDNQMDVETAEPDGENQMDVETAEPDGENQMYVETAKADGELRAIALEMKAIRPTSVVHPSENIFWPVNGIDSDYHRNTTLNVDAFLYGDFFVECRSKETSPLTFISHSLGTEQLRYMFTSLVPLKEEEMKGKTVVDIGSRLGTVLYAAHYYSGGSVKAVGIEMNKDFYALQRRFIQAKNMANVEVICDNLVKQKDVIANADVITMNNVFSFFMPKEEQIKCWRFLSEHTKPGCVLIHNPSVESVVKHLNLGFNISKWLDHIPTERQAALFAGDNEQVLADCKKFSKYEIRAVPRHIPIKIKVSPTKNPSVPPRDGSITLTEFNKAQEKIRRPYAPTKLNADPYARPIGTSNTSSSYGHGSSSYGVSQIPPSGYSGSGGYGSSGSRPAESGLNSYDSSRGSYGRSEVGSSGVSDYGTSRDDATTATSTALPGAVDQ